MRLPDFFASDSFCLCTSDIIPMRRRVYAGSCQSTAAGGYQAVYAIVANASVGIGFNTNVVGGRGGVLLQS